MLILLLPAVGAQTKGWVTSVEQAKELTEKTTTAKVKDSQSELTEILEVLARTAPKLDTISINHMASKSMELRALELLVEFKQLDSLSVTGDAFL
jgi:hypothetical protein